MYGEKESESECKEEDHDLQYGSGSSPELRQGSLCCLLHWNREKQHLLQRLQEVGAQEMQRAETPIIGHKL